MYERANGGLGLSLTPPDWLKQTAGAIASGITLTVPTPAGPIQVTPGQVVSMTRGARVSYTPPRPGTDPMAQAGQFVERNVPGGWATVALVGAAVVGAIFLFRRKR